MRRRRIRLLASLVSVVALVAPAPSAAANGDLPAIAAAYARGGGVIPPCQFSSAQLGAALGGAGGDIQQYGADLLAAIRTALTSRAAGVCDPHPAAAPLPAATLPAATPPPAPVRDHAGGAAPAPPAPDARLLAPARLPVRPVASRTSSGGPAPLWALAVLAALSLFGAFIWLGWRRLGFDPAWSAGMRHNFAEASERVSALLADLGDWSRLPR